MKKNMCCIMGVIAMFAFILYFDSFHKNLEMYNTNIHLTDKFENMKGIDINLSINESSKESTKEIMRKMHELAIDEKFNLIVGTGSAEGDKNVQTAFVYLASDHVLIPESHTWENELPDFRDVKETRYITDNQNDNDKNAIHVKYYDKKFNEKSVIYEFKGFQPDDPLLNTATSFVIQISADENANIEMIQTKVLEILADEQAFLSDLEGGEYIDIEKTKQTEEQMIIVIFLSCLMFVYTFLYFSHREKEIAIRKLNGNGYRTIYIKIASPLVVLILLSYLSTMILMFLWKVHDISLLALEFVIPLIVMFLCVVVALLAASISMCYFFYKFPIVNALKKKSPIKSYFTISSILKIATILIFCQPCITMVTKIKQTMVPLKIGYKYEEFFKNYSYINRETGVTSEHREELYRDAYIKLSEHGAVYANYETLLTLNAPSFDQNYTQWTEIAVNSNFLDLFPIQDINGNQIHVPSDKNAMLIPISNKDDGYTYLSDYCQDIIYDIIYIPDHTKIPVIDGISAYRQSYVEDAVICVINQPSINTNIRIKEPTLFINSGDEDPTSYVKNIVGENAMTKKIDTLPVMYFIKDVRLSVFKQLKSLFLQSGVYGLLLLSLIYQNVFLYYYQNKAELAIRYLHGNSYKKRFGILYVTDAIYVVFSGLFAILLMSENVFAVLIYCIFIYLFNCLVTAIIIFLEERKNRIQALKGEE